MSRSLGDSIAKKLGVISTPIVTTHDINFLNDLFIVIASDGIWEVMDNEDVSNFVDFYRSKATRIIKKGKQREIGVENACVAQLLCEEARMRWLHVIEEDDVVIDDISCLILELTQGSDKVILNQRKLKINFDKGDQSPDLKNLYRSPTMHEVKLRDPNRNRSILNT